MSVFADLLIIVLIVAVHEFGHYFYAKIRGFKGKFKITWFGVEMERPEKMSVKDDLFLCLFGILFGLSVAIYFVPVFTNMLFFYYILCTVDITKILIDIDVGFKHGWNITELDICKLVVKGKYK